MQHSINLNTPEPKIVKKGLRTEYHCPLCNSELEIEEGGLEEAFWKEYICNSCGYEYVE